MSRQLPARPNLEHLKNQAKTLLEQTQLQNRSMQLADAQHELARSYGFASWPKLKLHVESVTARPFAGRWQANLERSEQHPDNPVRSALLDVMVSGNVVTITQTVVDQAEREQRGANTICVDGEEHAADSGHGYSTMARWEGDRAIDVKALKDGALVGWGRYEVSADGNLMTVTADRMRILFERVAQP